VTVLPPRAFASLLAATLPIAAGASLACHEDPPLDRHEPMRPLDPKANSMPPARGAGLGSGDPTLPTPMVERPPADPAITKAIDLVGASGLRFIDQAADETSDPSEYTAEQFAGMLRKKWDWIGYDICELDPWLDEIATRSFKTNLPYQVVLADGTSADVRGWLDQQLAASEDP
jgi:hypothetical protein